jgi:hypothetical protein
MGCWNGTCFLSHLPINHGDRVRIILLKKNKYVKLLTNNTGCVYPDTFFKPFYFSIGGEYDDYGGIEEIEDTLITRMGLEIFKSQVGGEKSTQIYIGEKEMEEWSWENIWRSLERGLGKFYLEDEDDEVEFGEDFIGIMIRQDVWDRITQLQLSEEHGWSNKILSQILDENWKEAQEEAQEREDINNFRFRRYDHYNKMFDFFSVSHIFRDFNDLLFSKSHQRDEKISEIAEINEKKYEEEWD